MKKFAAGVRGVGVDGGEEEKGGGVIFIPQG